MDNYLNKALLQQKQKGLYRTLKSENDLIDFCSNDYLGFAHDKLIHQEENIQLLPSGSTGSRLLSGNSDLVDSVEKKIALFHKAQSALIFTSGYTANLGLMSCILQKEDTVLYDRLIHASIRDGIKMTNATAYGFDHNDTIMLEDRMKSATGKILVVVESVYSMDGDSPPLVEIANLVEKYHAHLLVDEAHAVGIFGNEGRGLVNELGLEDKVWARVITFGKALGVHGAAVLGSDMLREYLINFCRPFIFTTALSPTTINAISYAYDRLINESYKIQKVRKIIKTYKQIVEAINNSVFLCNESAIQGVLIPGNHRIKETAIFCQNRGMDVRPILSPTVPKDQERLRICLHVYNTPEQIQSLINTIGEYLE